MVELGAGTRKGKRRARRGIFWNLKNDIVAGLTVAVVSIPAGIGIGAIMVAPLGADYAVLGASAGLLAALFATLIPPFLGSSRFQFNGPGAASAGILAGVIGYVAGDSGVIASVGGVPADAIALAITAAFFCCFAAGVLQVLIGQARLGEIVKLIPFPVIAGLTNGIVALIILHQIPNLLGLAEGHHLRDLLAGDAAVNPLDVLIAAATGACIFLARRFVKLVPDLLVGLVGGALLYQIVAGSTAPDALGPTIGAIPVAIPFPDQAARLWALVSHPQFPALLPQLIAASVTLALITAIGCLITAATVDSLTGGRHRSAGELTGLGSANMVAALFGGLASGGTPSRVMANHRAGGRTRLSHVTSAAVLLVVIVALGPLLAFVPLSAVACVLLVMATSFVDGWTKLLVRKVAAGQGEAMRMTIVTNLSLVLLVALLMVFSSLAVAVVAGMLLEFAIFLLSSRRSLLRRQYSGETVRSNTVWNPTVTRTLAEKGHRIQVFELQGNLFFGTADYLAKIVDEKAKTASTVILDFKRVTDLDSSGALILKRIDGNFAASGRKLYLSYLPAGDERRMMLYEMGLTAPEDEQRYFDDTNTALAAAERALIEDFEPMLLRTRELDIGETNAFARFSREELARASSYLERRRYDAGSLIFVEDAPPDGMYVLTEGRVSVVKGVGHEGRRLRLVTFGTGAVFGEMAILARGNRSAGVEATDNATCFFLGIDQFEAMCQAEPDIAVKLLVNISATLSRRLSAASATIRDLES